MKKNTMVLFAVLGLVVQGANFAVSVCETAVDGVTSEKSGAQVTVEADGRVKVSAERPISTVTLKWNVGLSASTRVLGDAWERTYGDAYWRPIGIRREMPWYFLSESGGVCEGWGVETQPNALACWRAATNGVELVLDVRAGGRPVELKGRTLDAVRIVRAKSRPGESTWDFGRRFCRMMCPHPRLPKEPIYGYNDWYCAYGRNTATNFLADAAAVVSLCEGLKTRPFVVMDDGWQENAPLVVHESGRGPWDRASSRFGMPMADFAAKVAALGAKPGLWYRPLRAWDGIDEHERLLQNGDYFDPTVPSVKARIFADMRRFRDWGFKLVKIDFLTFDICNVWPCDFRDDQLRLIRDDRAWRDCSRTTAEVMKDLYGTMREGAGDDVVIIGCNALNHLAAGVFEVQRTGNDTSGKDWSWTRGNGVNTLAMRGVQDRAFFAADADCAGLAAPDAVPWRLNRQWIELLSRSGTPFFVSWSRSLMDDDVRTILRDAFARAASVQPTARAGDWMDSPTPVRWTVGTYDWNLADRSAWFREARFGMFIHWGVYSIPAKGEWSYANDRYAPGEYEANAKKFNPVKYNPREWAKLAKAAGMRYAVLTSRHHDGFCMFDSRFTDYKITKSPYGRDAVREFLEAFRAEGLKVGLYHSLPDWTHPGYADTESPECLVGGKKTPHVPTPEQYAAFTNLVYNHVNQLTTEYGKLDLLFLDYTSQTKANVDYFGRDRLLEMIYRNQPDILVNDRLSYYKDNCRDFDYYTPEICVPNQPQTVKGREVMWETCATMNDHWGYCREDENWKTPEAVIAGLVGCVSRSGNLLLNVGPTELGEIPEGSVKILKVLADWQGVHGESVTGCGKSEFTPPYGCVYTQKGDTLYCHFLQSPLGDTILPQLKGKIAKATLLRTGEDIEQVNNWGFELLKPNEQRIRTRAIRPGDVIRIELK